MSDPVVVLDSGVLDRATTDRSFRLVLRELLEEGWVPVIPTVVLAEAVTGRPEDAPVNQVVNRLGTVDTTLPTARRAGQLRYQAHHRGSRRNPSGIDAIVAAHAADAEIGVVFTTDPSDLCRLLEEFPRVRIERV